MQQLLLKDHSRYFGGVYIKMLKNFSAEICHNLKDMESMIVPFCILFGQLDELCNIKVGNSADSAGHFKPERKALSFHNDLFLNRQAVCWV